MKKKILIFIDWFLPGINSGGPVRSYFNMISHLEEEFDFYSLLEIKIIVPIKYTIMLFRILDFF